MPTYTLDELIKMDEPQARQDKALIGRCVDGLGLYAAQIAADDRRSSKIGELRKLTETLVGYWGLADTHMTSDAKPLEDYLRAFDDKVDETRTGGVVTGDVYQTAPNVIYGLYRYGEDMVVSQGIDAAGEILDMSKLIDDIAEYWGFEMAVTDDLTSRLEANVRGILADTPLPGQPVSGVVNAGYAVTNAVMFENGLGFALAHHPDAPSPFVTWRFGIDDEGGKWYEWGHYFSTESRALIDFINRAADYKETHKLQEKPLPFTAPEVRGEKPSVMEAIRAAQKAPLQPREPKPERDKKKTGSEL